MTLADQRRIEATRDRTGWGRELPEPLGFEQIVARFQGAYPDEQRREWMRERLEAWRRKAGI